MNALLVVGAGSLLILFLLAVYGAVALTYRIPAVRRWLDAQMPERAWWDR